MTSTSLEHLLLVEAMRRMPKDELRQLVDASRKELGRPDAPTTDDAFGRPPQVPAPVSEVARGLEATPGPADGPEIATSSSSAPQSSALTTDQGPTPSP
jgi:hypothetical protein